MNILVSPTIAVVDDHDFFREEMSKLLTMHGFTVIVKAINGKDFLRQMASTQQLPDLCLLDINMPETNGFQTASCIKCLWPEMKVLACTFNNSEMERILECGADACMLKGSNAEMFKAKLMDLFTSINLSL